MRPRVRRARRDRRAEQHDDRRVAQREPEAYQSRRPLRSGELAGHVVDGGDVVAVDTVSQPEAEREQAGAHERRVRTAEREQHQEQDTERQRDAEQCSSRDGVVLRRAQRGELLVITRVDDRRRRVCILSSRRLRRRALRSCGASLRVLRTPRIVLRLISRASSAA